MAQVFDPEKTAVEREALLNGHFLLSSGLHSEVYFQCAKILQWPDDAARYGYALASKIKESGIEADVVLAPAMGGLFIGHETARALGCRSVFLERIDNIFQLRRGFEIKPDERVVIIEDVLTTGKSTFEVLEYVNDYTQGEVVAVGCLADRIAEQRRDDLLDRLQVPFHSVLRIDAKALKPEQCPLCKKGVEVTKPGSRKQ